VAGFVTVAVRVTTVPKTTLLLGDTARVVDVTPLLTVTLCVTCVAAE
jgi:hypothetical protein